MKKWLGVAVDSSVPWPTVDTTVAFQGHEIVLRAATETTASSVEIEFEPPMTEDSAHLLVRRFLSSLAWVKGHSIRDTGSVSGSCRVGFGRSQAAMVLDRHFRADYLPEPSDHKVQLALALYREALGLNSSPYQFLGFFKIINVLHSSGKEQKAWITDALSDITQHEARRRVEELRKAGTEVATYLYESCRCAVAHAFDEPVVDPDKLEDHHRLEADLPVIKALAEHLIEHELGVKSQRTIWQEHLYELDGFRRILGPTVVAALKAGQRLKPEELPNFPSLSVRLRDYAPFASFENLSPEMIEAHEGCVALILRNLSGSMRLALTLHVAEERLGFDPTADVWIRDDGTPTVVAAAIDQVNLIRGLIANGELEVWRVQPESLLGRCDPCLPRNLDSRRTKENLRRRISELEEELERRKGDA